MTEGSRFIIDCKDIVKTYDNGTIATTVLKGISLQVKEGEFVAIMGPSGSGKSTLMNILGLLDTATSGTYVLNGVDVSSMSDDALADMRNHNIGFVFQSFNLLGRASVLRNVTLPLVYLGTPHTERETLAKKAVALAGLEESHLKYTPSQLSGGQMQRVAIARALVNNPKILFADEPTGNLDSKTGLAVLQALQKLNDEDGRTIILITHERYIAEHADRIVNVLDGNLVEDLQFEKRRLAGQTFDDEHYK